MIRPCAHAKIGSSVSPMTVVPWNFTRVFRASKLEDIDRSTPAGRGGMEHSEILEIRAPRAEPGSRWAERITNAAGGPPSCACGCGEKIQVKPKHRSKGLPRYRPGHHPNPIRRAYEALRAQGLMMLGEVCEKLGIGRTTLRRYEAKGLLPPIVRRDVLNGRTIRVFTAQDLRRLRNGLRKRVRP